MSNLGTPSARVFDAQAVTGSATYTSKAIDLGGVNDVSWMVAVTGTPSGTLSVEVSNASDQDVHQGTDHWTGFSGIPSMTVSAGLYSGAAVWGIEIPRCTFRRARLKWVNGSGTGSLIATACTKRGG